MSIRTLYFIGQCLSLDEHPTFRETIIVQFTDENYDWNQFIWTCSNHLVLPVIYLKFLKHDLLSYVPDVLAEHLEEIYTLNRTRNEQILLQMKEINDTLNAACISPIYLKGTGNLIDGIYSDIGERIIGDIDLLVPEKDFLAAADLFIKEGYEICIPSFEQYDQMKHYPRLWKEDVAAEIEIHRLHAKEKHITHFKIDLIHKSKKNVPSFPGCFVLADDHKVIQSFIHSQLDNSGHTLSVVSLRDINDLYCFSKRVDLAKILQITPFKHKWIAYFTIAQKLTGLPISLKNSWTTKFFLWKHDLNLTSSLFSSINRLPWVINRIVFRVYPKQIREAFRNDDARKLLIRKLRSKEQYVHHLKVFKKMITGIGE